MAKGSGEKLGFGSLIPIYPQIGTLTSRKIREIITSSIDDLLVEATDKTGDDVVLVLVDSAKYVLNYWPNTVVNNKSQDFTIKRHIDVSDLQLKL